MKIIYMMKKIEYFGRLIKIKQLFKYYYNLLKVIKKN